MRWGWFLLGLIQVVCPLLFFTNLTRNPYFTQIALLFIGISMAGLFWAWDVWLKKEWTLPRLPLEWPMAAFLLLALISTAHSWFIHPTLRSGIVFEGARIWVFTLVNSVLALYLPLLFLQPMDKLKQVPSIWTEIFLVVLWSALWLGFSSMRNPDSNANIWDTYGGFLWGLAILYTYWRSRGGHAINFIHMVFAVSLLASLYGLLQYSGRDTIWTSLIQPYGGRPVSTFGNPNFLSSYVMLVSVLALAFAIQSKGYEAAGYLIVSLVNAFSVLCTLTRSTYIGLFASYVMLAVFLFKKENIKYLKWALAGAAGVILLVFLFPRTPVSATQSPLARFTELFTAYKANEIYQPWHQRILIWSSAWGMVLERPFLGKGWGVFELFFPFYQGKIILIPGYGQLRTHANNAHNILLELWSQVGTLGAGFAVWLFVAIVAGGWMIMKSKKDEASRIVLAGLLAGTVGMVVDNFFGNVSIFFAVPAFLFWWNVGLLFNEDGPGHIEKRPLTGRGSILLVVFAVFCFSSAFYYARREMQEVYYFKGFKEAKMNMVPESIKSLEEAFAWFPGEVNTNYELGNSYARHSKTMADNHREEEAAKYRKKAEFAYRASLKANPGYDEIYFNVGITCLQDGNAADAERFLEMAVFINPLLREAYGTLGNVYLNRGAQDLAKRILEQSVIVFPRDKDLWNNLGVVYNRTNEDVKSIGAYKKAVSIDPGFTQSWQNLYTVTQKLKRNEPILEVPGLIKQMEENLSNKNYPGAKGVAEKIIRVMPESADAHLSLANILFYLKDLDGSLAEFDKAIAIKPDFSVAYVNKGRVLQFRNDFAGARQLYNKALVYDGANADAKSALASLPN